MSHTWPAEEGKKSGGLDKTSDSQNYDDESPNLRSQCPKLPNYPTVFPSFSISDKVILKKQYYTILSF